MSKVQVVTYGVRTLRSTPRALQGCAFKPEERVTVPSPQAGEAVKRGVLEPLFAQLYLRVPGVVCDPSAEPKKLMPPTLMVPPAVNGVGLPFVYRFTPVAALLRPKYEL
jgi:hypothetical protein